MNVVTSLRVPPGPYALPQQWDASDSRPTLIGHRSAWVCRLVKA